MSTQKFTLDFDFPDLEQVTPDVKHHEMWINMIADKMGDLRLKPINQARFEFFWAELGTKRPKASLVALARYHILKALVKIGVLKSDGWKHVVNWTDHFYSIEKKYEAFPGVTIIMKDAMAEFNHLMGSKDRELWNINDIDLQSDYKSIVKESND